MNEKKVLLITEDEVSLRKVLRDSLQGEGFSVLEAVNGADGLQVALEKHPHLILLDILMPTLSGIEVLKKLRESGEWGKKVSVIFLTNLSPDDERINRIVTDYEPAYYLLKSNVSLSEIVEKVKESLASNAEGTP